MLSIYSQSVDEFLNLRDQWRRSLPKESDNIIICDPGDEIICDLCNADAATDDDIVWSVCENDSGLVYCKECLKSEICDNLNVSLLDLCLASSGQKPTPVNQA